MIDNTTVDWFGLQGREEDGWTAIQFKRLIDTCDYMDVPIEVSWFSFLIAGTCEYGHVILVGYEHPDICLLI